MERGEPEDRPSKQQKISVDEQAADEVQEIENVAHEPNFLVDTLDSATGPAVSAVSEQAVCEEVDPSLGRGCSDACVICMETEPTVTILPSHNCPQCVSSAWKVCEACDHQLLSRLCPVCKHEYKELMFHVVHGIVTAPSSLASISDPRHRYLATMKTRFLFEVIERSNSAVWCSSEGRIYFSLPMDMSLPPQDMKFILVSIPLTTDKIVDGERFRFLHSVWDDIENELETGLSESFHEVSAQDAKKWIVQAIKKVDSKVLTSVDPVEWQRVDEDFLKAFDERVES